MTGKNQEVAHKIATAIKNEVKKIDGVVDARVIQRLNYPAVCDQGRPGQGGRAGL